MCARPESRAAGRPGRRLPPLALGALLLLAGAALGADRPRIALIIDDLGNALAPGREALALPGALTYAFLPHTPFSRRLAEQAHAAGREVMLHLPMESTDGQPLGSGGLSLHLTEPAFRRTLDLGLASVPHVAGVNNHMGSLLTRHPGAMQWLMDDLSRRGLFFVDSRTTAETVAERLARENAVPAARRHVFLDGDPKPEAVRRQLATLIARARRDGVALGIGHPHPGTLRVLAEELPRLDDQGIDLVPVSHITTTERSPLWHVSSSPSPKVAKSSKPSP